MVEKTSTGELKMMSRADIKAQGWIVPTIGQFSSNMEKRLKKIRGENTDEESFLAKYKYNNSESYYKA